jgi:hypothetical protein
MVYDYPFSVCSIADIGDAGLQTVESKTADRYYGNETDLAQLTA